jgi:hypothetical protein
MITLYHGSNVSIDQIDLSRSMETMRHNISLVQIKLLTFYIKSAYE